MGQQYDRRPVGEVGEHFCEQRRRARGWRVLYVSQRCWEQQSCLWEIRAQGRGVVSEVLRVRAIYFAAMPGAAQLCQGDT